MTVEAAASEVVVHQAGNGPGTWAMGSLFEHLVAAGQTDGRLGTSLVTQPPGTATPLHRHTREAEALFLPQGLPHAFRVRGTAPARFLALTVPGGLMGLYDEVGIPAREMRLPGEDGLAMADEIARWNEVGPRYGLEVVGPPIPA
jgi:hypothetical protein